MGFLDLNIAMTGLFTSQRSLSVVNHNIANANTEGYSRQQVSQKAQVPMSLPDHSGMLGMGVVSENIEQIRNGYLDYKYWNENKTVGEWDVKQTQLAELEAIFNEPSETGVRKVLDEFFSSLQELSKNPADMSFRSLVAEKASTLTQTFNNMAENLLAAQQELNFAVGTKVEEINSYTSQVVSLNKQIFRMEVDGTPANDLRDQRNLIVDNLSRIANIQVEEVGEPGKQHFRVLMNGMTLVDHYTSKALKVEKAENNLENMPANSMTGVQDVYEVRWEETDLPVSLSSGELKGYLDVRDGRGEDASSNSSKFMEYRGVPYYLTRINKFVNEFAVEFNKIHRAGFDLEGNAGSDFFVSDSANDINARNISVSSAIQQDLRKIAAADDKNGTENNKNVNSLLELHYRKDVFSTPVGTPDDFVKSILSSLAVDSQQAVRMEKNQRVMIKQINKQRMSISGVSMDEEMTNMIKFQHVYSASARMITTMDELYDTMINRLGLVGR